VKNNLASLYRTDLHKSLIAGRRILNMFHFGSRSRDSDRPDRGYVCRECGAVLLFDPEVERHRHYFGHQEIERIPYGSEKQRRFKNTFADFVENKELPVDAVIRLLFMGFPFSRLPPEVQSAVGEEMTRRFPDAQQ
jgi:hypothetical protein